MGNIDRVYKEFETILGRQPTPKEAQTIIGSGKSTAQFLRANPKFLQKYNNGFVKTPGGGGLAYLTPDGRYTTISSPQEFAQLFPGLDLGQIGKNAPEISEDFINVFNAPAFTPEAPAAAPPPTGTISIPRGETITPVTPQNTPIAPPPPPAPTPTPAPPAPPAPTTPPPIRFKESAAYKALSKELQELVDIGIDVFFQGGEAEAQIFSDALKQAQALADPYSKSQLSVFQAEFGTMKAKTTSDFETQKEILERTRQELTEDLSRNKEFLSLEQQSEIARTISGYNEDLLGIADVAAEKGLTFATGARSRVLAEERRKEEFGDVIQSNQRRYNFQVKEIELRAARGDTEAQKQLETIKANKNFELRRIGQSAEQILGSRGAGELGLEGFTPVGGVLGSVEQERRKSILDTASLGINN